MTSPPSGTLRFSDRPDDYRAFGVKQGVIEIWEDGARASATVGAFEWWYFDVVLPASKTVIAVVFFSKMFHDSEVTLAPRVSITINSSAGPTAMVEQDFAPSAFDAKRGRCDVRIDRNTFTGDLETYEIDASIRNVTVKATLRRLVPSLRLGTGHLLFETVVREHFFAWLPSVPVAVADVTYTVGAVTRTEQGLGYHDHNWGDADLSSLIHDWYWARATIDGYTVIAACITSQAAYGSRSVTVFYLEQGGKVIAEGSDIVQFAKSDPAHDPVTLKPFARRIAFSLDQGRVGYEVGFDWSATVYRKTFEPVPSSDPEVGGAYHRFTGSATLNRTEAEVSKEFGPVPALWEMMFFGSAPHPGSNALYATTLSALPKLPTPA